MPLNVFTFFQFIPQLYSSSGKMLHHRRAARGKGEVSPAIFEDRKKCPDFGKKGPNCVHPWVESSIQNAVLRISRRKSSKIFANWAFFVCVFDEKFIEAP